ncbi:MAG: hypothetical protein EBS47_13080, partial [Betaproteobacteria bacterium]|nr:hypothetical protein [Betaproteobacteria bacterium]
TLASSPQLATICRSGSSTARITILMPASWSAFKPLTATEARARSSATPPPATEVEMKEKKARVEDALHATRAAVEEGIVAGGGVALLRARASVAVKGLNADQEAGIKIVMRAVEEPLRQIVANCGEEASVVVSKVLEGKGSHGYNAASGEYGDMLAMGVVDPTKVTRTALQNAASIASLMLTTDCMVAEAPAEEKAGGGMPGGMGGMGGMGDMGM